MNDQAKSQTALNELSAINILLVNRCVNHAIAIAETNEIINQLVAQLDALKAEKNPPDKKE